MNAFVSINFILKLSELDLTELLMYDMIRIWS